MSRLTRTTYKRRLMATLASQGAAYGFTLTIWGSGAIATAEYGVFTVPRALMHIGGPLLMYALLLFLLYRPGEPVVHLSEFRFPAFGFMDFLSVPAALGAAYCIYRLVPSPMLGSLLGTLLATLIYNLLLAMQLLIPVPEEVQAERDRQLTNGDDEDADQGSRKRG